MWTPVVLEPIHALPSPLKATEPMFNAYALGWDVTEYGGTKIIWHGGAVFGFLTAVVLIPEKHVGFSIQINSEDGEINHGRHVYLRRRATRSMPRCRIRSLRVPSHGGAAQGYSGSSKVIAAMRNGTRRPESLSRRSRAAAC